MVPGRTNFCAVALKSSQVQPCLGVGHPGLLQQARVVDHGLVVGVAGDADQLAGPAAGLQEGGEDVRPLAGPVLVPLELRVHVHDHPGDEELGREVVGDVVEIRRRARRGEGLELVLGDGGLRLGHVDRDLLGVGLAELVQQRHPRRPLRTGGGVAVVVHEADRDRARRLRRRLARGRRGGARRQDGRPAQGGERRQGPPAGHPLRATVRALIQAIRLHPSALVLVPRPTSYVLRPTSPCPCRAPDRGSVPYSYPRSTPLRGDRVHGRHAPPQEDVYARGPWDGVRPQEHVYARACLAGLPVSGPQSAAPPGGCGHDSASYAPPVVSRSSAVVPWPPLPAAHGSVPVPPAAQASGRLAAHRRLPRLPYGPLTLRIRTVAAQRRLPRRPCAAARLACFAGRGTVSWGRGNEEERWTQPEPGSGS